MTDDGYAYIAPLPPKWWQLIRRWRERPRKLGRRWQDVGYVEVEIRPDTRKFNAAFARIEHSQHHRQTTVDGCPLCELDQIEGADR